ncbi:succinate dehydrogenase subunit 5, mitochondrial [Mercurialis annua]|uniref:succinate dehydrogenase subunit 5, mitochondrial n=1 Tax=Mercurialis annua TaxID=3986 RepID=UPI002160D998|nr:succinate dehydrogenase subunit 5, mitochondrial [Mercurialis annua]
MEKMVLLRSLCRAASSRSSRIAGAIAHHQLRRPVASSRSIFTLSSSSNFTPSEFDSPLAMGIGSRRFFSEDVSHFPAIQDPDVKNAFKDLMAASWDDLPHLLIHNVKNALSKNTDDKAGQDTLKTVFAAAEAVEEFCGMLISLKMELDDSIGMSGEDVKPLSDEFANALRTSYQRYSTYLDAFGPDEGYLRKKVETELGSKMIYLKMRCSGLGSEWGKVTVLGTSGMAGSYVEQRA